MGKPNIFVGHAFDDINSYVRHAFLPIMLFWSSIAFFMNDKFYFSVASTILFIFTFIFSKARAIMSYDSNFTIVTLATYALVALLAAGTPEITGVLIIGIAICWAYYSHKAYKKIFLLDNPDYDISKGFWE